MGTFQGLLLHPILGQVTLHVSSLWAHPQFSQPCGCHGLECSWSSNPGVWEPHLWSAGHNSWGAWCGVWTLCSSECSRFDFLSHCVLPGVWFLARVSQLFLSAVMWFPPHLPDVNQLPHQFLGFFHRKFFHIAVVSLCPWKKVELGSSYVTILNENQFFLIMLYKVNLIFADYKNK